MGFELTDEQVHLREVIRAFTAERITPVASELEASGVYPEAIVEELRQLGLFGLTIPEADGGLGADLVSMAIVFEEISRGGMGVAGILGSHSMACKMIADHGTPEQRVELLPDLASGARRT